MTETRRLKNIAIFMQKIFCYQEKLKINCHFLLIKFFSGTRGINKIMTSLNHDFAFLSN